MTCGCGKVISRKLDALLLHRISCDACNFSDHIRKLAAASTFARRKSRAKRKIALFENCRGCGGASGENNLAELGCSV
jgi:hypothetical protein